MRTKKFIFSFQATYRGIKKLYRRHGWKKIAVFAVACGFMLAGLLLIWFSTFQIPTLDAIQSRQTSQSTKIYDNTGKILLYDVFQGKKRTEVPLDQISPYIKEATISIENKNFYTDGGIEPLAILRALVIDITTLHFTQGASTITQQVVKNLILTNDKTATRKLKELILSIKLQKIMSKDDILSMYLNEMPFGGPVYGVEQASEDFFGKTANDVDVAQAAYLAALLQAPSRYSPYGSHRGALDSRKNLVLKEMHNDNKISDNQYNTAINEKVEFLPKNANSLKAAHFVMFVIDYLQQKYGQDVLEQGGLKVVTTLNYDLQAKAESVAKQYADSNKKTFNASNDAFVAIDPKTGGIETMVGSRDYFDKTIDGQFNVTTAHRQPGSTFKPFVYAESFIKGYTPETVLFDVPTQFTAHCAPEDTTSKNGCYSPGNYDDKFRGPMTLREALAQSINVPAVKILYLAGVQDSINLATNMGIQSLGKATTYGLTLVLGGGEVSLLDMTSAYGVFANEGIRNPYTPIISVQDKNSIFLEQAVSHPTQVLDTEIARKISDILSDNIARAPLYGTNSAVYFPDRQVAVKTGTTNNYKDAWIIGYTPSIVVGTWAGNNDNTAMSHKVSGLIVAPMWRAFMNDVLKTVPNESFTKPLPESDPNLKPILKGEWRSGQINQQTTSGEPVGILDPPINPTPPIDSSSTSSATQNSTPTYSGGVHSILYWVNKNDPRGPAPTNPASDSQFTNWEYAVRQWTTSHGL